MGEHFAYSVDLVIVFAQQIMVDADDDFAAGFERRHGDQIQRAADRTFGRIFHRSDQIIRLPRFHQLETVVHRSTRFGAGGMAEMFDGGLLGKRSLRTEIGNGQRTFHRQTFAHNLPKQAGDGFVGQRSFVQTLDAAQHGGFALGTVHRPRAFQFADGMGVGGAFVEQAEHGFINRVNRIAVGL